MFKATAISGGDGTFLKLFHPGSGQLVIKQKKVIFVCDTSGSMSSWRETILKVVDDLMSRNLIFDVLDYATNATLLPTPKDLRKTWQNSGTNFRQAFSKMMDYLDLNPKSNVEFVFLTDGCSGDQPLGAPGGRKNPSLSELVTALKAHPETVTVHVFSLGNSADKALLQSLRQSGKEEGVYNEAKSTAQEIGDEVFASINFATSTFNAQVGLDGKEETVSFFYDGEDSTAEMWIGPEVPTRISISGNECQIEQITKATLEYRIASITRNISSIKSKKDLEKLQAELDLLKTAKVDRIERAILFTEVTSLQRQLDEIHSIFAQAQMKETAIQSTLVARLQDLSFKAKLKKSRQNRTMDKRVLQNAAILSGIDAKLENLPLPASYEGINPDLRDEIGGLQDVQELMESDKSDILMMGLQCWRTEIAIDQPAVAMVAELSSTFLTFSTFESAANFKIKTGHQDSTGNFDVFSVTEVISGLGRESINAILPLFVCEEHYQRVRVLLPLIAGFFFTLSESGFHPKQIPALYAVLARLHRKAKNEKHRLMVEQFRQVCARMVVDEDLMNSLMIPKFFRPREIVQLFCENVSSHQKSELPTLDILVGCLLAQDNSLTPEILPRALFCEAIRRYFNDKLQKNESTLDQLRGLARDMLFGKAYPHASCEILKEGYFENCKFVPPLVNEYQALPIISRDATMGNQEWLQAFELSQEKCNEILDSLGLVLDPKTLSECLYSSVLQGAWASSNDSFREMVDGGLAILDPLDKLAEERLVEHIAGHFDRKRQEHWKALKEKRNNELIAEFFAFNCDQLDNLLQMLRELKLSRGNKLWEPLVENVLDHGNQDLVPLYVEKLVIMTTGKFGSEVLIEGESWMAGPKYGRIIRECLEKTEYKTILEVLDAAVLMHQYRHSDIPNRHGFSMSNPLWVAHPDHPAIKLLIKKWDA